VAAGRLPEEGAGPARAGHHCRREANITGYPGMDHVAWGDGGSRARLGPQSGLPCPELHPRTGLVPIQVDAALAKYGIP